MGCAPDAPGPVKGCRQDDALCLFQTVSSILVLQLTLGSCLPLKVNSGPSSTTCVLAETCCPCCSQLHADGPGMARWAEVARNDTPAARLGATKSTFCNRSRSRTCAEPRTDSTSPPQAHRSTKTRSLHQHGVPGHILLAVGSGVERIKVDARRTRTSRSQAGVVVVARELLLALVALPRVSESDQEPVRNIMGSMAGRGNLGAFIRSFSSLEQSGPVQIGHEE